MVASVTEGEDKPLKYPLMFRACELVRAEQDRPAAARRLRRRQVGASGWRRCIRACRTMLVSARTGEGVDAFRDWLAALPERRLVEA